MLRARALFGCFLAVVVLGCGAADGDGPAFDSDEPYVGHDEASDFTEVADPDGKTDGVSSSSFNHNNIVNELFFTDVDAVDAAGVQTFFEQNPYGKTSFLATETINGRLASEAIVEASRGAGVNPIVMIARMQVEKGLVSKTTRPSQTTLDHAFGCGCADGSSCSSVFSGLDRQVSCAAETLTKWHGASMDGTGQWRVDHSKLSSDGVWVKPQNHATAAMYAYTPWVLPRRGGNWLVWNITRRFALHFSVLGLYNVNDPNLQEPFVGTPCVHDGECEFTADGKAGFCFRYQDGGFCALSCEGLCPDRADRAITFCVDGGGYGGICAARSGSLNHTCADIPGTQATEAERYVGSSGVGVSSAIVCMPPN